jgi:hypothetical protein
MSYTIVADVCEGLHDCVLCCPVEFISHGRGVNAKGADFVVIDLAANRDHRGVGSRRPE